MLDWWAGHRAVRNKDAAIAEFRFEPFATALAVIENRQASVGIPGSLRGRTSGTCYRLDRWIIGRGILVLVCIGLGIAAPGRGY